MNDKTNDHIKIEKNVPFNRTKRNYRKYPWDEMEVGDSIFIDFKDDERHINNLRSSLHSVAIAWCLRNGKADWKFSTAVVGTGVRIWRMK